MILAHPTAPPRFGKIMRNEGPEMRKILEKMGITTPELISISKTDLIEEYIEGGNLYIALASGLPVRLAFIAGSMTGKMHEGGYVFIDNKAQNYLVRGESVVRTDLGFIQKSNSYYARSMDVGSFLASIMDLRTYREAEMAFFYGYMTECSRKFSYLSIIIRNILSIGFSSNSKITLRNMIYDASTLIDT